LDKQLDPICQLARASVWISVKNESAMLKRQHLTVKIVASAHSIHVFFAPKNF
jgi:hypothetical protein